MFETTNQQLYALELQATVQLNGIPNGEECNESSSQWGYSMLFTRFY
jgi:hypothetical protein